MLPMEARNPALSKPKGTGHAKHPARHILLILDLSGACMTADRLQRCASLHSSHATYIDFCVTGQRDRSLGHFG